MAVSSLSVLRINICGAGTRPPPATVVLHHDQPKEGTAVQDFATTEWCRGKEGVGNGAGGSNHRHPLGGRQQGGGRGGTAPVGRSRSMRAATREGSLEGRRASCTRSKPCHPSSLPSSACGFFLSGTAQRVTHTREALQIIPPAQLHRWQPGRSSPPTK